MTQETENKTIFQQKSFYWLLAAMIVIGLVAFVYGIGGGHPARVWQTYLINFLLWSAIAQGAVVFSAVTHITGARWSGPLSGLAEAFAVFFPLSFILFLLLFLGQSHIFPWLNQDLHGKEVWLNVPFLFLRDCFGLLILYGLGLVYLYNALRLKFDSRQSGGWLRAYLQKRWSRREQDPATLKNKLTFLGGVLHPGLCPGIVSHWIRSGHEHGSPLDIHSFWGLYLCKSVLSGIGRYHYPGIHLLPQSWK